MADPQYFGAHFYLYFGGQLRADAATAYGYHSLTDSGFSADTDATYTVGETEVSATGDAVYKGTYDGAPVFSFNNGQFVALITNSIDPPPATLSLADLTIENFVFCFARGTRIATPEGEVAVETLSAGSEVLNTAGAAVKVKWIGRQTRHPLMASLHDNLPVRIAAGALGDGLPTRDLYVSPDHALLVQGCLVQAKALINGRSITQMTAWDGNVEYFHIETEHHELILAEGAATETFIDNLSREKFDNHAEYAALYPDAKPMVELDLPRICYARQLPRAISRVLDAVADEVVGKAAIAA